MGYKVAVMGATGAVGTEMLNLLDERNFPVDSLRVLASSRSKGKTLKFMGEDITVEELTHDSFKGIEIVLSSAGGSISKEFIPSAVKSGAVTIDNTSYFRMENDVPLVVPEVNPEDIKKHNGIIANPNCSTIIMVLPLYPLHKKYGVKRVHCCTYQASSGAGKTAMIELEEETKAFLEGKSYQRTKMPHQYAFNLFIHDSKHLDNGYQYEELKMVNETRKMFHAPEFMVNAVCVRVPVLRAHSEALNIELEQDVSPEQAYDLLKDAPGVDILEDKENNRWPMPLDATGKDPIYVGRIRRDISQKNTLDMWITGDQIRKGAALNAIQIAEML